MRASPKRPVASFPPSPPTALDPKERVCGALLKPSGFQVHAVAETAIVLQGEGEEGQVGRTLQVHLYPECTEVGASPEGPIPRSGSRLPDQKELIPGLALPY